MNLVGVNGEIATRKQQARKRKTLYLEDFSMEVCDGLTDSRYQESSVELAKAGEKSSESVQGQKHTLISTTG